MAHDIVTPRQRKIWYVQIKKGHHDLREVALLTGGKKIKEKRKKLEKGKVSKAKASTAVNRFLWKLLVTLQTQMLAKLGR